MNILITGFVALAGVFGASVTANSSLPGDVLYPVKVYVNENVKHALAVTASQEAQVSTEIIAARAEEMRTLESEGRLDTETRAKLQADIQAEIELWNNMEEEMKVNGDAEAHSTAEAMFANTWQDNVDVLYSLGTSIQTNGTASTGASTSSKGSSTTTGSATGTLQGVIDIR